MDSMLSEAEAQQMMDQAASNASSQCQGGSMSESAADAALRSACRGSGPGMSDRNGAQKDSNEGGRGVASGGNRTMRETQTGIKRQNTKGKRGDGDVIARQLVEGQSPVGESRVALQAVAERIATGADHGTDEEPVPAHLRTVHQKYFGDMQRTLEQRGIKPGTSGTSGSGGGADAKPSSGAAGSGGAAPAAPAGGGAAPAATGSKP